MKKTLRYACLGLLGMTQMACSAAEEKQPEGNETAASPQPVAGMSFDRLDPALDAVIAPGTQIEKVATGFTFTEGPIWNKGRLLFADLPARRIIAMTADGKFQTVLEESGGPLEKSTSGFAGSNGMAADKDGTILVAQHAARRIGRFDGKQITNFLDKFEGKRFNSPNDLVFAPDGSLWFTDPSYGLKDQDKDSAKEVPFNGVYRYAGGKVTAAIKDITMPNGIGFSPDGKTLYVNNSGPKMALWRYDVSPEGTVSNGRALVSWPGSSDSVPDGLKVDTAGNVWATGPDGIRIITPEGKVLGQIKLPEVAANLAFADGGKTAYITGSTSIYRLKLAGTGVMPLNVFP